jgi:hypothetical protein
MKNWGFVGFVVVLGLLVVKMASVRVAMVFIVIRGVMMIFTPEQHQKILYGEYYNGLDQPLKTVLQVKIARSWAREQERRQFEEECSYDEPPF